jgi:hypothetical protein
MDDVHARSRPVIVVFTSIIVKDGIVVIIAHVIVVSDVILVIVAIAFIDMLVEGRCHFP